MTTYNFPSFRPTPPKPMFTKYSSSDSDSDNEKGERPIKYILVTGGVISGVGKGIITSSIGVILKSYGVAVSAIKIDPYLNIDAGTFSPYEHGEVFVLDDGGEVDLDLGNYERFLDCRLHCDNNITTGKIYELVMRRERRGDYLGKTVQVIPHITDAIMEWVERVATVPVDNKIKRRPEVCLIELGGTAGDIEGRPFIEAFRQFQFRVGRENFMTVHVSLIIEIGNNGEHKTKPTQNSVATLRGEGIWPDIVVCRSTNPIGDHVREKLKTFCDFCEIINVHNVSNIYHVPVLLQRQNVLHMIKQRLGLHVKLPPPFDGSNEPESIATDWSRWLKLANFCDVMTQTVTIALVGKYVELAQEAYTSICKALTHASIACGRKLLIKWIMSPQLEEQCRISSPTKYHEAWKELTSASGVLVPGGFGERGVEGKIAACQWARTQNVPFLGVCLGMQCAVIEYARNVCGIRNANSTEFNANLTPEEQVIIDMPEHTGGNLGGTMRRGKRTTAFLTKQSVLRKLYGLRVSELGAIDERHRHRYEVNPKHIHPLTKAGLRFVGLGVDEGDEMDETQHHSTKDTSQPASLTPRSKNESARMLFNLAQVDHKKENETLHNDGLLDKLDEICERVSINGDNVRVEICELINHTYYVGVQYHPEYQSHPMQPSAPFFGLILAASGQLKNYLSGARVPSPPRNFVDLNRSTSHVKLTSLMARHVLESEDLTPATCSTVSDIVQKDESICKSI